MPIIDENGDLFGRVNVVDALVVLLVLAVAVAGATFVLGDEAEPAPTGDENGINDDNVDTETNVLLRTNLSIETAESIAVGDEYRSNDRTIATIMSVDAYPTGEADEAITFLGVTYRTERIDDRAVFGNTPVREGATLPFETLAYSFEGEVVQTNALEQRGEPATRTVTLTIDATDRHLAEQLSPGMAEQLRGETIASLLDVEVAPTTVIVTDADGELHQREHPEDVDVTLTVDLAVYETQSGVLFKGERLRYGDTVVLDLGTVTVRADVTGFD